MPRRQQGLKAGETVIAGVAWQQHVGISGVEVQIDEGAWQQATLATAISDDTWVQWMLPWTATEGDHLIRCRATSKTGECRPRSARAPIPTARPAGTSVSSRSSRSPRRRVRAWHDPGNVRAIKSPWAMSPRTNPNHDDHGADMINRITVAEAVGRTIARLGAARIFGVVGSGNFHVTNTMIDHGVPFTAARHEMGAATMADALGRRTSGLLSVLSVHQGCGLTNALTGSRRSGQVPHAAARRHG